MWTTAPAQHSVHECGRKSNHSCPLYLLPRTAISLQSPVSKADHTELGGCEWVQMKHSSDVCDRRVWVGVDRANQTVALITQMYRATGQPFENRKTSVIRTQACQLRRLNMFSLLVAALFIISFVSQDDCFKWVPTEFHSQGRKIFSSKMGTLTIKKRNQVGTEIRN